MVFIFKIQFPINQAAAFVWSIITLAKKEKHSMLNKLHVHIIVWFWKFMNQVLIVVIVQRDTHLWVKKVTSAFWNITSHILIRLWSNQSSICGDFFYQPTCEKVFIFIQCLEVLILGMFTIQFQINQADAFVWLVITWWKKEII